MRIGDTITFGGRRWTVAGLGQGDGRDGHTLRCWLRDEIGLLAQFAAVEVLTAKDFRVEGGAGRLTAPQLGLLQTLTEQELANAQAWERDVLEVETGYPGRGVLGPVRSCFDPATTTLAQRTQAKSRQLQRLGLEASVATVRRMRVRYREGLMGLVPRRREASALGSADPVLVEAIREELKREEYRSRSRGWKTRLHRQVGWRLEDRHEDHLDEPEVKLPGQSAFNKLLNALEDKRLRGKNMAQRRWWAARPKPPFTPTVVLRPGEVVMIDSTPLDMLIVLDDGTRARSILTIALDVATRCVCGVAVRVEGTSAVDAIVLLAQAVTPLRMQPGWAEALRMQHSLIPYERLLSLDERFKDAAARPVIMPETIVVDQGKVFISQGFLAACEHLGISVQPVPPANGPAKGHVERTFGSLGSLFVQYFLGHVGSNVTERGTGVEEEARWTLPELNTLLQECLVHWHNRPHDGLRHPLMPEKALSPNEMWAALVAVTGHVPVPLGSDDFIELLPVRWNPITDHGIRFDYRTYDSPALNSCRNEDSGVAVQQGRWEVHHNPYDPTRIWVRLGEEGFVEVPWIHAGEVSLPFTRYIWQHIRRVTEPVAGREEHEKELARALDDLLRRVAGRDKAATGTEKRIVAKARATASLAAPEATLDVLSAPTLSFALAGATAADEDDETVPDEDDDLLPDDDEPAAPAAPHTPDSAFIRDDTTLENDLWL